MPKSSKPRSSTAKFTGILSDDKKTVYAPSMSATNSSGKKSYSPSKGKVQSLVGDKGIKKLKNTSNSFGPFVNTSARPDTMTSKTSSTYSKDLSKLKRNPRTGSTKGLNAKAPNSKGQMGRKKK